MQNLELQVLWLDDSLGLAINQRTPKGLIPLTSYSFWPISEAWEQLRFELDSKSWIPDDESVKLLNSVVDIMNRWQEFRTHSDERNFTNEETLLTPQSSIVGLP